MDQTLTAALDCFESLLAYGANIAMVMAAEAGVGLGSLDSIREKLCAGRGGPSLGDWIAVLEEAAASKQLVALGAELPLGEIRTLLAPSVMDVRRRLTDRRNDQAHLRRPKLSEAQAVVDEALTDLTTLMGQAVFLTDLTLIHVDTTEWDSFHKTARVRYRALMGDHPVVPYRTTEQPRSGPGGRQPLHRGHTGWLAPSSTLPGRSGVPRLFHLVNISRRPDGQRTADHQEP